MAVFVMLTLTTSYIKASNKYAWAAPFLSLREGYSQQDLNDLKLYIDANIKDLKNIDISPYLVLDSIENNYGSYRVSLTWLGKRDRFTKKNGEIDFQKAIETIIDESKYNNFGHQEDSILAALSTNLDKGKGLSLWVYMPNDDVDFFISLMQGMSMIVSTNWHEGAPRPVTKLNEVMEMMKEPDPIYQADQVDIIPDFPGGTEALHKWLPDHLKYPEFAQRNGIEGRVLIGFIVEKDGSLSNFELLQPVDLSLNIEALRVVESLPNFIPAVKNGEPVRCEFHLPISYRFAK